MPIIEIDKSVLEEIEDVIDQRDKMYENQIASTKKLTDSIEKVYEQELKKLRKQLQQKENIIKEVREYITSKKFEENFPYVANECQVRSAIIKILDKKEVN